MLLCRDPLPPLAPPEFRNFLRDCLSYTDIDGATGSTYAMSDDDVGKTIKVRVSFTDNANNQETLTSAATAGVAPQAHNAVPDEEATEEPVWSADMLVKEYTSVCIGAASSDLFSNIGGSAGLQIKSLWSYTPGRDLRLAFKEALPDTADLTLQVGDLALPFPAGSSGQDSFKWTDVNVDWEDGQTLAVRIVPTPTTVAPQPNSPATGAPAISGVAQVGETLTADASGIADEDGLDNASFSYQWVRNDGNADADIQDATNATYTPTDDDVGQTIRVRVSFSDNRGNEETLTSQPTEVVNVLVWTATLTAGSSGTHSGYSLLEDTGALSLDEFSLSVIDYSVKLVALEGDDGLLSFAGLYAKSRRSNGCHRSGAAAPAAGVGRFFTVCS